MCIRDRDYSSLARVYRQQQGQVAYFIWDQHIQNQVSSVLVMRQAMERGGIVQAADTAALAQSFGIPEAALEATLQQWAKQSRGSPDVFGRMPPEKPLTPPYFAARITGAVAHTQGGLVVDAACRVMLPNGQNISGLYAGGNAIAGVSGDTCTGYLSGNGLLVAYTSGYLIGRTIASELSSRGG